MSASPVSAFPSGSSALPSSRVSPTRDIDAALTPLMRASMRGSVEEVRELLSSGADANERDAQLGRTALMWASDGGVIQALLTRADVEATDSQLGRTALCCAAASGKTEAVRVLLAAGKAHVEARGNDGYTPLICASAGGHVDVVRILVGARADVGAQDEDGFNALQLASGYGHVGVVRELLRAGASTEARSGWGALMWAATNDRIEVVGELIAAGAAVDTKDKDGWTPLMWSAKKGSAAVVRALLAAKADPGTTAAAHRSSARRETALSVAGSEEVRGILLAALHSKGALVADDAACCRPVQDVDDTEAVAPCCRP